MVCSQRLDRRLSMILNIMFHQAPTLTRRVKQMEIVNGERAWTLFKARRRCDDGKDRQLPTGEGCLILICGLGGLVLVTHEEVQLIGQQP